MRVVVHYFGKINPATEMAIASERLHFRNNIPGQKPPPLLFTEERVKCVDRHDYGDSLTKLWRGGEGFINVEHDVAPWPGALTQLWECKMPWCLYPILVMGTMNITNFAAIKFSSEFIELTKDIWEKYPRNDVFDWQSLDSYFHQTVREKYPEAPARVHVHYPPVLHCNWYHLKQVV